MLAEGGVGAGGAAGGRGRGRGGGGGAAVGRRAAHGVLRGAGAVPAPAPRARRQGVRRRAPPARPALLIAGPGARARAARLVERIPCRGDRGTASRPRHSASGERRNTPEGGGGVSFIWDIFIVMLRFPKLCFVSKNTCRFLVWGTGVV